MPNHSILNAHGPSDYYPFGLMMSGRSWSEGYLYGFNGKELDAEGMGGNGSTYDYGFRIYNPAIAKFLNTDPIAKDFPYLTPYQYASNTPIMAIDLDGLEAVVVTIRPVQGVDPALTQVNVQKVISQVDQSYLTVTYNRYDAAGNLINSTSQTGFIPGSVEAQLAYATDANGNTSLQKLQAGTYTRNGQFTQTGNQDQQSHGSNTTALNGFQYNLDIQYQPDGFQLNNTDLAPTTPQAYVNKQILKAQATLTNTSVPLVLLNQINATADLTKFNITIVGQTDGTVSNHQPQTAGNNQPAGNPALAQDRANVVSDALHRNGGLGNNPMRTVSTQIVTNPGTGANQQNRSTNILITR